MITTTYNLWRNATLLFTFICAVRIIL